MDEMKADIMKTIESIKCQPNATLQTEGLLNLASKYINSANHALYQEVMLDCDGIALLLSLITKDSHVKVIEAACYALAVIVENNDTLQHCFGESLVFSVLEEVLRHDQYSVRLKLVVVYLLLVATTNNSDNQVQLRLSGCLGELFQLFRSLIPLSEFNNKHLSDVDVSVGDLWTTVVNAIAAGVNTPQNVENQRLSSVLLPHSVTILQQCDNTVILKTLVQLMHHVVENNAQNGTCFYLCNGLHTLINLSHRIVNEVYCSEPGDDNKEHFILLSSITSCVDNIVNNNDTYCTVVGQLGFISVLLLIIRLPSSTTDLILNAVCTLAHCTEQNKFNQRNFIVSGGFTTLFQLLTKDDKCAKFSRCIRFVLLNCIRTAKASDQSEMLKQYGENLEKTKIPGTIHCNNIYDVGKQNFEDGLNKNDKKIDNVQLKSKDVELLSTAHVTPGVSNMITTTPGNSSKRQSIMTQTMDVDMPSVSTAVSIITSTVSQPADLKSTKEIETPAANKVHGEISLEQAKCSQNQGCQSTHRPCQGLHNHSYMDTCMYYIDQYKSSTCGQSNICNNACGHIHMYNDPKYGNQMWCHIQNSDRRISNVDPCSTRYHGCKQAGSALCTTRHYEQTNTTPRCSHEPCETRSRSVQNAKEQLPCIHTQQFQHTAQCRSTENTKVCCSQELQGKCAATDNTNLHQKACQHNLVQVRCECIPSMQNQRPTDSGHHSPAENPCKCVQKISSTNEITGSTSESQIMDGTAQPEQRPSDLALSEHKNEKAIFKIPEYRACGRKRKLPCTKNKLPHRMLAESNNASGDTRNIESTIIVSRYSDSRVTRQLESVDHVTKVSCYSPHGTIESKTGDNKTDMNSTDPTITNLHTIQDTTGIDTDSTQKLQSTAQWVKSVNTVFDNNGTFPDVKCNTIVSEETGHCDDVSDDIDVENITDIVDYAPPPYPLEKHKMLLLASQDVSSDNATYLSVTEHSTTIMERIINKKHASTNRWTENDIESVCHTTETQYTHKMRRRRVDYSKQEVANLLAGVNRLGKQWTQILDEFEFHKTRTATDLKDKFKQLKKRHRNED